jgi:hypothetical protein
VITYFFPVRRIIRVGTRRSANVDTIQQEFQPGGKFAEIIDEIGLVTPVSTREHPSGPPPQSPPPPPSGYGPPAGSQVLILSNSHATLDMGELLLLSDYSVLVSELSTSDVELLLDFILDVCITFFVSLCVNISL